MEDTGKGIATCPSCRAQYEVPLKLQGKRAACKKCGSRFLLQFPDTSDHLRGPLTEDQSPSTESMEVAENRESSSLKKASDAADGPFLVTISEDQMTASLSLAKPSPESITVEAVKEGLASHGICYGIVSDEEIENLLKRLDSSPLPLIVAQGRKALEGQSSEITYYFDTDPLKIGTLKQDGVMDFRDRGEIPQVRKGELLAMKSSGSPGEPGMNILGAEIPCPKIKDVNLRCGKGVKKPEDGLKAHALLDGEPVLSADGKLSVFPKLQIPGDVDLKTGHVKFDGDIDVRGTIQNDFRVEGGRLSAGEILRTDVNITGDVNVAGGIIGATIHADGSVKARYIHEARIHALGDVVVEKEVIDSDITTSGGLFVKSGKVFNSHISAKMGVAAGQIGSEGSKPCGLMVGVDEGAQEKTSILKNQMHATKTKQKKFEKLIPRLQAFSANMHREIAELAQVQDRGTLEQKSLREKVEEMKKIGNNEEIAELSHRLEELDTKIRGADARLGKRMDQQEAVQNKADQLATRIAEMEPHIALLAEDIERIEEWSQSAGGSPTVEVTKTIYANTNIKGPHCSIRLRGNKEHALFTERQVRKTDSDELVWEMVVKPLR